MICLHLTLRITEPLFIFSVCAVRFPQLREHRFMAAIQHNTPNILEDILPLAQV